VDEQDGLLDVEMVYLCSMSCNYVFVVQRVGGLGMYVHVWSRREYVTSKWFIDVLAHLTEVIFGSICREFCFRELIISREVVDVEDDSQLRIFERPAGNHINSATA
jgi:hypothetical protein